MKEIGKEIFKFLIIIFRVFLVSLIFLGIFKYLNGIMLNENVKNQRNINDMPKNSVDVIFLGSSHAQFSASPVLFHKYTNLNSYNMGSQCQPLEVSYEMVKEALKTQKPKLAFLEIYRAMPYSDVCKAESNYIMAQYLLSGKEKQNVLDYLPKEKALEYRQEFLNNHNNWKNYKNFKEFFVNENNKKEIDYYFGHHNMKISKYQNFWLPPQFEKKDNFKMDETIIEKFEKIYKLCKENDIELMLFLTPEDNYQPIDYYYRDKVFDWAIKNNIKYIDFTDITKHYDYFMQVHGDSSHSNIMGANLVTYNLAKAAKKNFKFDKSVVDLNNLYNITEQFYVREVLENELNPYYYLPLVSASDNIVAVKYVASNYNILDKYEIDFLKQLGYDIDFEENYFAIYQNGKKLVSSDEKIEYDYKGKKIKIDDKGIFYSGKKVDFSHLKNLDVNNITANLSFSVFSKEKEDWIITKNIDYAKRFWEAKALAYAYEG